ncbi:MAG TPA: hypothetical protein VGL81_08505 [Polyangiaceae bacterium]|jgi:hypothetical protein
MDRTPLLVAGALAAVLAVLTPKDAHALGPIDLEVAAQAGGGTNPTSEPINPLGVGLGGRAGVALFGFYGGVNVIDYLGGSQTVGTVKDSAHALLYGVDLGYNLKVSILTIRPLLGLGNFELSTSPGGANPSYFYLQPGLTALVSLGLVFVGADANLLVLPSVSTPTGNQVETAFTLHGQIGLRF